MAFDVAGAIPEGVTITSVTLTLNMSKTVAADQEVSLYRLLADWGEGDTDAEGNEGGSIAATTGDATWVHNIFDTEEWETAGGDFSPQVSATQSIGSVGSYTWESADAMVADVQFWLDGSATNFGWLLMGNESINQTSKRFDSKEHGDEGNRPTLTVSSHPEV